MEVRNNKLYLGGIRARDLLDAFGSPLYVYEEDTLRERARELIECISYRNKEIKYACKANTNISLMRIFFEYDMGIDAVSPGEILAALKAGYSPDKILFTANNPAWDEIEYAVSKKVMVNIDSLFLLRIFGKNYPGKEVCIRINPDVGAGHHNHVITGGPESKFGISYTQEDEIKRITSKNSLKIAGLHQHIGSGILNPEMFIKAMDILLEIAISFNDLKFIDFGGGFGVPYQEEEKRIDVTLLGKRITEDFNNFCTRYGTGLKLVIEPGRYLVAEGGFLLARVTSVKEEKKHRFVGVDTGFNHLIRPAMYGSYHHIIHADRVEDETIPQVIAGNLCESGDTFTRDENSIVDRNLPRFEQGDTVCICNAGAYGYSMSSCYNSRPRPAEVLVKNGKAHIIRKRESLEEIFSGCTDFYSKET